MTRIVAEQREPSDEDVLVVRQELAPLAGIAQVRVGGRHHAVVRSVAVGADDPAARDVVGLVEMILLPHGQGARGGARPVGVDHQRLGRDRAAQADQDEALVP
jgi:hypothetical protein